ncbi:MraY family glycosyltransferase [Tepidibacillus sp. HK-1]|uniref:MraY family glycosyltransferase n=1 Tax=Tepidibacillus sp. HK-1 TaxID=1883407 RepID=UPI00085325F6|nr:MraY family glycosyltransferase [Tepidibacillus sp. HK-1]GBF12297.1 putative undecaprenyl-phosphate N-acetylglucosaminyl 1-phosphate transferase [Tepidibacillus sp. HK-1]
MTWFFIFGVPLVLSILLTPIIKKIAIKIGAVDHPNARKVHTKVMPRMGGVAIFLATTIGIILFANETEEPLFWILLGSLVIVITGIIDDIKPLSAKTKLVFQIIAAAIVVSGGVKIQFITVPVFYKIIYLGEWSWLVSILWIVGITNALNLIDGLDGLAAGVSSIALSTIFIMSLIMGNTMVAIITLVLLGATIGFLFFNFYPAQIFMGDSGSLYLGFFLSTLSILGFKNITVVSYLIPIVILGVPIFDTIFAIIRRFRLKLPITAPDKKHLHHCLIDMGFSHRKTVLIIYGINILFSLAAIFLSQTTVWIGIIVMTILVLFVLIGVEWTGILGETKKPVTRFIVGVGSWLFGIAVNKPHIRG